MKILITEMKTGTENNLIGYQILSNETDNIKYELVDVEDIEEKKGYFKELVYDKEQKKYKFEYRELPESEIEVLNKEILKLKQSIVDISVKSIKEKDFDDIPEIPEELGLSSSDIDALKGLDI